jgi:hypothetical protein
MMLTNIELMIEISNKFMNLYFHLLIIYPIFINFLLKVVRLKLNLYIISIQAIIIQLLLYHMLLFRFCMPMSNYYSFHKYKLIY